MSPFAYGLAAFVFLIATRLYLKHVLFRLDGYALALLSNVLGAIILFPFIYQQLPSIAGFSGIQILLILCSTLLWTYTAWAGNLSIAQNDFSFKEIVRQTRIIWVVLAGIFLLGEQLGAVQIVGIVLILSSVYIISFRTISWREHISSKPILLAWSTSFSIAITTILEKIILGSTPVALYAFLAYLLPSTFLTFFLNKKRRADARYLVQTHYVELLVVSVLMVCTYFTGLMAYKLLPISIAYPFIQSSTAIGVLIGTYLWEENKDWQRKLFAAVVAITGLVLIQAF